MYKKESLSRSLWIVVFIGGLLLIIGVIARAGILEEDEGQTAVKIESSPALTTKPQISSSPIPEILTASIDIEYQSTSSLPPLFSVTIPAGSKYHQEREALFVENKDLTVTICSTCQLFIPGCGGLADGDPKEGGCEIETLTLGEGIDIGMHYQPTEPNKVLGYFDNYENSDGDNISIRVTTSDFRELTESDKLFLNKIISSLR